MVHPGVDLNRRVTIENPDGPPTVSGKFGIIRYNKAPPRKASGLSDLALDLLHHNTALQAALLSFPPSYWVACLGDVVQGLKGKSQTVTEKYYLEKVEEGDRGCRFDVRSDKPKGTQAKEGRWCHLPRVAWPPKGEDTHAKLPLYSLHTSSRFEFSHDSEFVTTCGIWSTQSSHIGARLCLPTTVPAPLIGTSDQPCLGYTHMVPTHQSLSFLAAPIHGDRWAYHPEPEKAELLADLQKESEACAEGGRIFNQVVGIDRPPDSAARMATYGNLPHQDERITEAYSNGHRKELPHLKALAMRHLAAIQAIHPEDHLNLIFAAYIHRHKDLCTVRQHLHRDLDRTVGNRHLAFTTFTCITGCMPGTNSQAGYFVPRSVAGCPLPWKTLPMPELEGHSLTMHSSMAHCGGAQPPGLDVPGVMVAIGVSSAPYLDYSKTWPLQIPLWANDEALLAATDTQITASTSFPCSGCQTGRPLQGKPGTCPSCNTRPLCSTCLENGEICESCVADPAWHHAEDTAPSKDPTAPTPDAVPAPPHEAPLRTSAILLMAGTSTDVFLVLKPQPRTAPRCLVPPADAITPGNCPIKDFAHETGVQLPDTEDCVVHLKQGPPLFCPHPFPPGPCPPSPRHCHWPRPPFNSHPPQVRCWCCGT